MKIYRDKLVNQREVVETLCNCCGEPAVISDQNGCDIYWACTIDWRHQGPFPGQQTGEDNYDICKKCFNNFFKLLLRKLPPNSKVYDIDSNRITTTP